MARYGYNVYGTGKYGPEATTGDVKTIWLLDIDWDGDGEYDGSNEADRMVGMNVKRGRRKMLDNEGFLPMGIGKGSVLLDNEDRRYDPYNTDSDLYPNVKPGRLFRLRAQDASTATVYDVMEGVIANIVPVDINGEPHVRLMLEDGMGWLNNKLTGPNTLEGQTIQTIVEAIVNDVDSPWDISADDSTIQTTDTRLFWYTWKRSAYKEIQEMADAEAGVVFHSKDGTFYFYNRDFTHNRSKAVDEDVLLRDIAIPQPWEIIRNDIVCEYHAKEVENLDTPGVTTNEIWSAGLYATQLYVPIADGATVVFDATFKYQDYRMAGYNVRNNAFLVYDTDLIDQIQGDCTISWETPVGGGTVVSVTNNAGEDGLIVGVELAGDVLKSAYDAARSASDATSIAAYGQRTMKAGSYWAESPIDALEIADWLLGELKDPTIHPVIQFEDQPSYQFYFDLWDRVELTLGTIGISGNFRVGGIEHEFTTPSGQGVRTAFYLEPYFTTFS